MGRQPIWLPSLFYLLIFEYICNMKKVFSVFLAALVCLFAASSCTDDAYDLNKDIDKTIELKNFSFRLNETYNFGIQEILLSEYPVEALVIIISDISVTLKNGLLGDFKVTGIAKDLTTDYLFSHGVVTATVINNLPQAVSPKAVAIDSKGNSIESITAVCSPNSIPKGESTITVDVKSAGNMNFDGVRFTINMGTETQKVKFNKKQDITIKDFVISFPDGIAKKGK